MTIHHGVINKFNRGEIESNALARDDVTKVRNTASSLTNFMPLRLGPMSFRPGMEYLSETLPGVAYMIPFIAAADDYALLEITNNQLRVWVDDAVVAYTSVTSTITNSSFTSNITSWTDASGAGSSTAWKAGSLGLLGANTTSAVSYQSIASTDITNEHAMIVTISRAPVIVQVGTSGASSTEIVETTLSPGVHVLVFTPAANITITFSNFKDYYAYVDSVTFSGTADLTLSLPLLTADLATIRQTQSADVVFLTHTSSTNNAWPLKIERRGVRSWGFTEYRADDGPFKAVNVSDITLTASALNGEINLTASKALFSSDQLGTYGAGVLYKITSSGQNVTASASAQDTGTNSIQVVGITTGRTFTVIISGTFVATVTLQRSVDDVTWEDTTSTWTAPVNTTFNDSSDNSIFYYRLHIKTGDYTSGTAELELVYAAGSITGVCRLVEITSSTVAVAQVLEDFGSTDATRNWFQGEWTGVGTNKLPSSVALYEGRLWFAGLDRIWGSVSDVFDSFATGLLGDSRAISKTIGFGPTAVVNWLMASSRLIMGIATGLVSVRSNSFGEPLTQDNCNLKQSSIQGVNTKEPINIDEAIYYIHRSTTKIYNAEYDVNSDKHATTDVMLLNQSIASAGIKRIAVSTQPETRVWVVLDDGEARVYLLDDAEEVRAWSRITTTSATADSFEDVVVLPGTEEDSVYFVVNRTQGRYLEKMAKFSESKGASVSKHFDSFKTYTSPGLSITGLSHVDDEVVGVWADGRDQGTYTVSSGAITVPDSWVDVVVGLPITAEYVTNKVASYIEESVINRRKRIVDVGLVLKDYWPGALKIGPSAALLEILPLVEDGEELLTTQVISEYDTLPFTFNGITETDPRIHMRATAPVTVQALTYGVEVENTPDD